MGKKIRKIDSGILIPIILFAIISLITISSASTYISSNLGNLMFKQLTWYGIGTILVLIIMHYKNEHLYRNAY